MLFQAGGFIVSLLLWQVSDILGQSKTDWILRNVSLIAEKLNERDTFCKDAFAELKQDLAISDKLKELKQEVSLISGKVTERDKLWQDKFTELNQEVDSLTKRVSDIPQNWTLDQTKCSVPLQIPSINDTCIKGQPHINGTKRITLWGNTTALCDTTTDGGGWIIIQRRTDGDVAFYRGWEEYKTGFGNLDTSFWLGNNAIHLLTDQGYNELRVDMISHGKRVYAHYSDFYVASEANNYLLTVGGYEGTVRDSLRVHNNMSFSTFDRDNDKCSLSCAETFKGAWWYSTGHDSNLNGLWGVQSTSGVAWYDSTGWYFPSFTEMKIRRG